MIKNVKLFINNNSEALEFGTIVKEKFEANGFKCVNKNYDLGIAIGGDGSFLRMIKKSFFNSNAYFVGINYGTLGFLQEVKVDEVDKLIDEIKNVRYKVDEVGIQETVLNNDEYDSIFYSFNEIVVRNKNLKNIKMDVLINDDYLETFVGDGVLVATSQGSTAHNLSYGGSIVYNNFSTLQLTPLGPINSRVFHTLSNSLIIPEETKIVLKPHDDNKDILVTIDGDNKVYKNTNSISTSIRDKKIKCLRFSHYNFSQKINEKLISNDK